MGRFIDLTGQKFGMWTVLEKTDERDASGSIKWKCQCECGNIKNVASNSLRRGKSICCGCVRKQGQKDISNQRFDRLVALESTDKRLDGSVVWKCKCDCGNICYRSLNNLQRKDGYHSCGCYISDLNKRNLIGQKFGLLTVLEETKNRSIGGNIKWKCLCECGNIKEIDTGSLMSGNTQSCGCINYSIGEKNIETILKNNNLHFQSQYTETSLNKKKFDFAILKENKVVRLIEFDGEQHFMDRKGLWNSTEKLEDIQRRDKEKNEWAAVHKIPLVRIPYWERDHITLDLLLGEKYLVNVR